MDFVVQIIKIATSYYLLSVKIMVLEIQITWGMAAKIVQISEYFVQKHAIIVHLHLRNKQPRALRLLANQLQQRQQTLRVT